MQRPKFFPKSPQVKEILEPENPEDANNSLVKLIANVVEWGKWDINTVLDSPFVPMMMVVDAVIEQQKLAAEESKEQSNLISSRNEPTPLDDNFARDIISDPNQYR
ncbi:MAG: hypothetical protein CL885_03035 [Dehalococcoidia bacterium]|nr:hypothetical protein [Dehalococcoidia bacterium]